MESIIKFGSKESFVEFDLEEYTVESTQRIFRVRMELKLWIGLQSLSLYGKYSYVSDWHSFYDKYPYVIDWQFNFDWAIYLFAVSSIEFGFGLI